MKRTILGVIAVASFTWTTAPAVAGDITVRGSPTCREYLAAKDKSKAGDTNEAYSDLVWFLGYMSGLAVGTNVNVLEKGDNGESAFTWLEVYCPRKPTAYLSDAGNIYFGFLKQQYGLR